MVQGPTDVLAWVSVGLMIAGLGGWHLDRRTGRALIALAWVSFAAFWAILIPHFLLVERSAIEGVGSLVAVPAALYAGYLFLQGRDSIVVLTRAIAVMGVVYLPITTIEPLYQGLIELTTRQVAVGIGLLGYEPAVVTDDTGLLNTFVFSTGGQQLETFIVLACTGLGSMAIFAGLILAVRAPLGRKLLALGLSLPLIYVLNMVRNVWIAVAFGEQWLQYGVPAMSRLFGIPAGDEALVSFFLADKVLAQSASVVALVAITVLVVRQLPEAAQVLEEALYVLTRREIPLEELFADLVTASDSSAEPADPGAGPPGDD
jgi:archaeosortase A (PGF-CTERM-specific)